MLAYSETQIREGFEHLDLDLVVLSVDTADALGDEIVTLLRAKHLAQIIQVLEHGNQRV